jgi:hypothetical protein
MLIEKSRGHHVIFPANLFVSW